MVNVTCCGNQDRDIEASETHPNRPPNKTRNCYLTNQFNYSKCNGPRSACSGRGISGSGCEDCIADSSCDEVDECVSEGENYCESGNFLTEESCDSESICAWDDDQCWYDCDPSCEEECDELSNETIVEIPDEYGISRVYPNPFNPVTVIEFTVPEISNVSLYIYNANGIKVKELSNNLYSPGTYFISWDATSYSSGVYFIQMRSGGNLYTQKVMLVK